MDWSKLLREEGDPFEREATNYGLDHMFPRYAEFWGKYVYPQRRKTDSSKLREEFPGELEDIFNNHYSVYYQLTVCLRQIEKFDPALLDIGDPLFHLATSIDMVERTLLAILKVQIKTQERNLVNKLTKEEFDQITEGYWSTKYDEDFKGFEKNYRPINIELQSIRKYLKSEDKYPQNGFSTFEKIASNVRAYRNILAHSL